MTSGKYFVGLDVGGTTMKAAVVTSSGHPKPSVVLSTEAYKGQEHGLSQMCKAVEQATKAAGLTLADISGIGVATPGTMDIAAGIILDPPNLKPWQNVPVKQHIHDFFKIPTAFQNDANAAAFGEFWVGAGKGTKSLVMFTLGTGVGGGIIVNGRVVEGEHSHGGEIGHMKIEMSNPRQCGCGRYGCLEAYASATAVVKRAQEIVATKIKGPSILRDALQGSTEELPARAVFEAAEKGDEYAKEVIDRTAFYLAVGTTNVMHLINPDMIVFGGGMTAAGAGFLQQIRNYVDQLAFPVPAERTRVVYASLGSDAGFIGAAGCAKQMVLD